jgi:hypothetical protein
MKEIIKFLCSFMLSCFGNFLVVVLAMCAPRTKRLIYMNNKLFGNYHGISHFLDGFNVHMFKFVMPHMQRFELYNCNNICFNKYIN